MEKKVHWLYFLAFIFLEGCALFSGETKDIRRAEKYQLTPPKSWRESDKRGESDRAYSLASGKQVAVTTFCDRNRDASLKVLTRQILMGSRNIKLLEEKEVLIDGGAGLFTSVQATSDGKPFFLGIAVVKKLGCVFDFSLISPVPISQSEISEFLTFVRSLQYGNH